MAEHERKPTFSASETGTGTRAHRPPQTSGVFDDDFDLVPRDTIPAPPSGPLPSVRTPPSARGAPPPPAPAPTRGRYSSSPDHDEVDPAPPSERTIAATAARQRGDRTPVRVDIVGATTLAARHEASLSSKPRVTDRERALAARLSAREEIVLARIDGVSTVQDIIDDCAMNDRDVMAILLHFVRLDVVAL
jgi:hypothetical protein